MSVRRFVAASSREAMRQVREFLGEDALILSNRPVAEGVEILALAEEEQQAVQAAAAPAAPARPAAPADYRQVATAAQAGRSAAPPPTAADLDFAALGQRLLGEMQDMRALLDRRMQAPAASDGCRGPLRQRLLGAGFGPCLSDEILAGLPAELASGPAAAPALQAWLERQLEARLPVLEDEAGLLDEGGVIALVGPTGVGKTTTAAKLAARYVMRHGPGQVALISTDSFRIGAHEQLRIYARLLDVEVHTLAAVAPLEPLLAGLAGKRLIIIDTVGMSQRDRRLLTQINQLGAAGRSVRLMLLLNAACHGDTLEEVVGTYQRAALAAGTRLRDCIVSKCDEAARLGPVLDILMRHGLRLNYLSNGQQVPEDLQVAEARALLQQALAVSQPSPFVSEDGADGAGRRLDSWARGLFGRGRSLAASFETLRRELDGFALLERAWRLAALPAGVQGERLAAAGGVRRRIRRRRRTTTTALGRRQAGARRHLEHAAAEPGPGGAPTAAPVAGPSAAERARAASGLGLRAPQSAPAFAAGGAGGRTPAGSGAAAQPLDRRRQVRQPGRVPGRASQPGPAGRRRRVP